MHHDLITIIGPTACGKTAYAVQLAAELNTEIISADSRQVYRGMTIGTGKDLDDYVVNGQAIPYHLIDICEPGEKYNVFRYQHDFHQAYNTIRAKGKMPILCGGTGLYIESVLKGYKLLDVPENPELRQQMQNKSLPELEAILKSYKPLHNTTDVDSMQRAVRAIEIEEYYRSHEPGQRDYAPINSRIIGLDIDREVRRQRITARLKSRLEAGMIDEVKQLLASGLSPDDLIYYGLEYKYLTLHVTGRLSYQEMFTQLEIAIHQFAKRQMTWFRGMEHRGFHIEWIR
ncbi:MAG: tRNA dimethylallyltransferase [Candidatus Ordinivivax streblomastigis]|uniref:tRNA dimethylallyltransferase n=1 Tax=Candidatus Ordinivivax streblomastigis TaxID=2540710 RepID=A0A5M8P3S0_9BACT|nr:MAG: tRNA dimethylallyltransferase [Candidatus Ordinivivax streblomastigis]